MYARWAKTQSSFVPIIGCFAGRFVLYPLAFVSLVVFLLYPLAVVLLVAVICAVKAQTRKQRDEKAKGRESTRTRKQKDEKSRPREAVEKQGTRKAARFAFRLAVFAKTVHGWYDVYIGRFGGPWHTRIHACQYDLTHLRV